MSCSSRTGRPSGPDDRRRRSPGRTTRPSSDAARCAAGFVVVALLALVPATGSAQLGGVVAGHVGSSAATDGAMLDFAGELRQGMWGLRAGVALDAAGTALAPVFENGGAGGSGAWAADLDLGLNFGRVPYLDVLFGRYQPSLFVGLGAAGVSPAEREFGSEDASLVPVWTYGMRGSLPIATWLAFELEARHRQTFGEVAPEVYPASRSWEYRMGIALRFGGGSGAPSIGSTRAGRSGAPAGAPRGGRTARRDARRDAGAEEVAARTIGTGERYLGTPYRWGGNTPSEGFDCSGFVKYVFAAQGIDLPRVSRDQARAGVARPASLDGLARGDLLFFAQDGRRVDHVAIYAGDGRILHSSSSGDGVRYDDLGSRRGSWYVNSLVAVRRVIASYDRPLARPLAPRALPLDEAFEALDAGPERGDAAPPPAH